MPGLHTKPSLPKSTIRRLKLRDDDNDNAEAGPTSNLEEEEVSKLARFGPMYGDDTEANRKAKASAWDHILGKSRAGDGDETRQIYLSSIRRIEKEAMESYDGVFPSEKPKSEFRWMMVRDGCFFLQLALHILGAGDLLDYPAQNPYFGKKSDSTSWIPAMFFVGNQIPYVVIRALMKQSFFQDVIRRGRWQCPTDNLAKLVLYLAVVEPERPCPRLLSKLMMIKPRRLPESPSNILHILHALLLGPGDNDPVYSEMKEFHDLEAGSEDSSIKIPSAGELYKLGIKLRKSEAGISSIRFKNLGYAAYLHLPPFIVDAHTEVMLASLANHERSLSKSDREVTAYLRLMRDLVRTYKDFKILEKKGIIQVKEEKLKGGMVHMLNNLVTTHNSTFTLSFRQIRHKIKDYGGPPWRLISIILGVLAIVQTIFTVLSYFIPRN